MSSFKLEGAKKKAKKKRKKLIGMECKRTEDRRIWSNRGQIVELSAAQAGGPHLYLYLRLPRVDHLLHYCVTAVQLPISSIRQRAVSSAYRRPPPPTKHPTPMRASPAPRSCTRRPAPQPNLQQTSRHHNRWPSPETRPKWHATRHRRGPAAPQSVSLCRQHLNDGRPLPRPPLRSPSRRLLHPPPLPSHHILRLLRPASWVA